MIQLMHHFGNDSRYGQSEAARRRQWFIKARQEKRLREDIADRAEEDTTAFAVSAIKATDVQIEAFETKLDLYDTATVKALESNQVRLDDIQRRLLEVESHIQLMLDRAYVMEDGRRVFLTEDRTQAFDEFGTEVSNDELDFDAVPQSAPSYESFAKEIDLRNDLKTNETELINERHEIFEFQERLDEARERVADGEISTEELDDLDAELSDAMPSSIKHHVPGMDGAATAPNLKPQFTEPTKPVPSVKVATPAFQPDPM